MPDLEAGCDRAEPPHDVYFSFESFGCARRPPSGQVAELGSLIAVLCAQSSSNSRRKRFDRSPKGVVRALPQTRSPSRVCQSVSFIEHHPTMTWIVAGASCRVSRATI